jgi:hypothetical protein
MSKMKKKSYNIYQNEQNEKKVLQYLSKFSSSIKIDDGNFFSKEIVFSLLLYISYFQDKTIL